MVSKGDIINIVRKGQKEGKTFAATNGCFDILHIGHVRYLQKTKSFADYSIVMLNSDKSVKMLKGESRPINCEQDRAEMLTALSCVDYVVLFEEKSPAKLLEKIKPDIYTKGADYTLETLPEKDIVLKNNIKVEFIEFVQGKSTTNIIKKINN
ncbi:D-glycero-beta-D-manno-heptose 1-phosphate adenylyltransferase [bacterium]|nr:D-glycero-beta-D-manno-heptose 1-phosphate adenylyltransferase [bacterium]MBR1776474.1 D-glycero-beta-D-manno-heptose 1-phosphate adenylyltransferase [bacterium]